MGSGGWLFHEEKAEQAKIYIGEHERVLLRRGNHEKEKSYCATYLSELLVEGAHGKDPEKNGEGDERQEEMGDGKDGAGAGDLDEDDLDPGSARFAEARADDIDGGFPFDFGLLVERDVGHLFGGVEEGIFNDFGGDVLEGAEGDDEHKGRKAERGAKRSNPILVEEKEKESETCEADHHRRNLSAKVPSESSDDEAAEEKRNCQRADSNPGTDGGHEVLIGACFWECEFKVGFPTDFCEVDR